MKTYFTIMLRVGGVHHDRQWYVEEFPISDSLYKVQLMHGLVFEAFKDCEDAIFERIESIGGVYIDHVPSVGVKNSDRIKKKQKRETNA